MMNKRIMILSLTCLILSIITSSATSIAELNSESANSGFLMKQTIARTSGERNMAEMVLRATGSKLKIISEIHVTSTQAQYDTCLFEFDKAWDAYGLRTAVFYSHPKNIRAMVLDTNNRCFIPWDAFSNSRYIYIGVYGSNGESYLPTQFVEVMYQPGANIDDHLYPPTPGVYEQIAAGLTQIRIAVDEKAAQKDLNAVISILNEKADKAKLNSIEFQLSSLAGGSPKGVYATVAALQAAKPTGDSGIYVVQDDGKWYYWSGTSWLAGGIYQASALAEKSVSKSKTTFFSESEKNKLYIPDGNLIISGISVVSLDNTIRINGTSTTNLYVNLSKMAAATSILEEWFSATILDTNSGEVTFSVTQYEGGASLPPFGLRYHDNTVACIVSASSREATITPSKRVSFAYLFIAAGTTINNLHVALQVENGAESTNFVPYYVLDKASIPVKSIMNQHLTNKAVGVENTTFLQKSTKNLVNPLAMITGHYVSWLDGLVYVNPAYSTSEFPVESYETYTTNRRIRMLAFYDSVGNYVSGAQNIRAFGNFVTPVAKTAKVSFYTSDLEFGITQIEKGSTPSVPEPYYYLIPYGRPETSNKETFLLFLPPEFCVAVGRTIDIYNQLVSWCGNPDNFHYQWVCQVGQPLKRKFSVTGTAGLVGSYPLTLNVYDNNLELVASASSVLKIVPNTLPTTKKVLAIGDSLTNTTSTSKPWMNEIRTLSQNKIEFIGTRGIQNGEMHEGRSGWAASHYLAGTSYTFEQEGVHPFWDGTRFNWNHYKSSTGINPHCVQIWLGINGLSSDPTSSIANIKQMVDYIRQDDSNLKIAIVYTPYKGTQDGIGVQPSVDGYSAGSGVMERQEDYKVFLLLEGLQKALKGYQNLFFIPVAQTMDREHNYGSVPKPVHPRATQTELMPVEAVHPQTQGYLQIADTIFSSYLANLD